MDASFRRRSPVPFTVRVLRDRQKAWVCLFGELDIAGVAGLEHQIDTLVLTQPAPRVIRIDLSQLVFLDVVGARALDAAYARLRRASPSVRVEGSSSEVRKTLEMTRVAFTQDGRDQPKLAPDFATAARQSGDYDAVCDDGFDAPRLRVVRPQGAEIGDE